MQTHTPPLLPSNRGLERLTDIAAALPTRIECEQFYFLRHGQTECNARKIFQSKDEPLNATGLAQAELAAEALGAQTIATIVCSDMQRAHHTAHVVATRHDLAPIGNTKLRERNFGSLIGSSSLEIDWDCAPEAGETLDTFAQRSHEALHEALTHPGPVLVVAHGGTLYVLAALLNIDVTPTLLGNAHPLRFNRNADGSWSATPLVEATQTTLNLA